MAVVPCCSPEPENKAEYGKAYWADKLNKYNAGYTHPYHTEQNPLVWTHYSYLKTLFDAVGPEQVSPHYESLSRSRRGLIFSFAYIGSIVSIAKFGGWSHNEWMRGMIWHHEFLMALYIGFIEVRHFTFLVGPKFTIFYNVYSRYETQQFCNMWADSCEEVQMRHLTKTKEQMEYSRINKEYEFVKKRALVNFLTNSRASLENHFTHRASTMLQSIERYEGANLRALLNEIGKASFAKVQDALNDPKQRAEIQKGAFASALEGIRAGSMTYNNDPLLPILQAEIQNRTKAYQNLSAEEESNLLSLSNEQKRIISESDKAAKKEFLSAKPTFSNPGVKLQEKYKDHIAKITAQ